MVKVTQLSCDKSVRNQFSQSTQIEEKPTQLLIGNLVGNGPEFDWRRSHNFQGGVKNIKGGRPLLAEPSDVGMKDGALLGDKPVANLKGVI